MDAKIGLEKCRNILHVCLTSQAKQFHRGDGGDIFCFTVESKSVRSPNFWGNVGNFTAKNVILEWREMPAAVFIRRPGRC